MLSIQINNCTINNCCAFVAATTSAEMVGQHPNNGADPAKTAIRFFPTPTGANIHDAAVRGSDETATPASFRPALNRRCDASPSVQLNLVQTILRTYGKITHNVALNVSVRRAATVRTNSHAVNTITTTLPNIAPPEQENLIGGA
jgi:hypothetical protein